MRGNKFLVSAFIIATFAIWIAFDAWLGANDGPTESQVIAGWGRHSTFFPFLIGFLCGHWLLNRRNVNWSAWGYGLAIWVVLIAWDIWWHWNGLGQPWYRYSGLWLFLGLPAGSYLWGQSDGGSPVP